MVFTEKLSRAPEFGLNKETIVLPHSQSEWLIAGFIPVLHQGDIPKKYNAVNSATIIVLGPMTNLATIDSKLWSPNAYPRVFISSSNLKRPIIFPVNISKNSNVGIDPLASMEVFIKTSNYGRISILVVQQLAISDLVPMLQRVVTKQLPPKNLLVAQRMLDTLLYTLANESPTPRVDRDLTGTVVNFYLELIKTHVLCGVTFNEVVNQITFIPNNNNININKPQAYLATEIDLIAALIVIEQSFNVSDFKRNFLKCY